MFNLLGNRAPTHTYEVLVSGVTVFTTNVASKAVQAYQKHAAQSSNHPVQLFANGEEFMGNRSGSRASRMRPWAITRGRKSKKKFHFLREEQIPSNQCSHCGSGHLTRVVEQNGFGKLRVAKQWCAGCGPGKGSRASDDTFEVVVGNVGTVYRGASRIKAGKAYNEYVAISKSGSGRAGGEDVTIMADGEPVLEHSGSRGGTAHKPKAHVYKGRYHPQKGQMYKVQIEIAPYTTQIPEDEFTSEVAARRAIPRLMKRALARNSRGSRASDDTYQGGYTTAWSGELPFWIEAYDKQGRSRLGNLDGQGVLHTRHYQRTNQYKRLRDLPAERLSLEGRIRVYRIVDSKGRLIETIRK